MTQKRALLTSELLAEISSAQQSPCLSLYQPTHRRYPENQQDPIRFRNLVREMEASLRQKYPALESEPLLAPFEALARNRDFWNHTLDGLAVLGGPDQFRVFNLQRPVAELVVVADSFHTKPLRRVLQSADRYQILGLSLGEIRLFEGNRDAFDEIEPAPGVPRTITETLGDDLSEPYQTVAPHGGVRDGSAPIYHGHGGRKDQAESDTERFFRAVDVAVLEHHSRPSGLPLMLAGLPQNNAVFQQISRNPFLMAEGLPVHPEVLSLEELCKRAWEVVEPQYLARLATLVDEFEQARSQGLGSDEVAQIGPAAASGRVATLLIEADRQIGGRLESGTGKVEFADLSHPQVDDLLDDLGELVANLAGQVIVVPAERMPTRTGVAATYRY